jgi:hypothetical protein
VQEIDQLAAGRIDATHYTVNEPRFQLFGAGALLLWAAALVLRLTIPSCSRFP